MRDAFARHQEAVIEIAHQSGRLAQAIRTQGLEVAEKGAQDFVTQADKAVEALVRDQVARLFPGEGVLGEEQGLGGAEGATAGMWVVDPIDGTTNFALGSDMWGVSLAWVAEGRILAGAVYAPDRGEMLTAAAGGGSFLNGRRLRVNGGRPASRALVCVGRSARTTAREHGAVIATLLEAGYEYRRYGSAALGIAHIATGRLHGFLESSINSWDVLAGLLIAREAGAWCNDFLAGDGLLKGNAALACTPGLEDDLRARFDLSALSVMP